MVWERETQEQREQRKVLQLNQVHSALVLPSTGWTDQSPDGLGKIVVCKLSNQSSSSAQPPSLLFSVIVQPDLTWNLFVCGHEVTRAMCSALRVFPVTMALDCLSKLLETLDSLSICLGQPTFVSMLRAKKGKILSPNGLISCKLDSSYLGETVRTSNCEVLSVAGTCPIIMCEV